MNPALPPIPTPTFPPPPHSVPPPSGAPAMAFSFPDIDDTDVAAVAAVVRSGRLSIGPYADEFERLMRDYVGTKHAVCVSSGTAALHVIATALGIGPGDEVIVPSFTFAASVNAILFVGATPVFVDIEPDTFNLDPADVRRKITARTKAVMVVDVFGHPADWAALQRIADEFGLFLIDDCCEALGAEFLRKKIGAVGSAGAFGFYPNKQIATGEGGMIVTDDDRIAEIARSQRNQGRAAMGAWLEHERLGFNYRLDEMSAALGVTQMRRISAILAARERIAEEYAARLAAFEWIRLPITRPEVRRSWFVFVVLLAPGIDRDAVMRTMDSAGVPTRAYFSPIHAQRYIQRLFEAPRPALPVTEAVASRTIALPFHTRLQPDEIDRVVAELQTAVASVRR